MNAILLTKYQAKLKHHSNETDVAEKHYTRQCFFQSKIWQLHFQYIKNFYTV